MARGSTHDAADELLIIVSTHPCIGTCYSGPQFAFEPLLCWCIPRMSCDEVADEMWVGCGATLTGYFVLPENDFSATACVCRGA